MDCAPWNISGHFDFLFLRAPYKFKLYLLKSLDSRIIKYIIKKNRLSRERERERERERPNIKKNLKYTSNLKRVAADEVHLDDLDRLTT